MPEQTVLYLDLEDTVIDSWDEPYLKNMGRVKDFIDRLAPAKVRLFSFAINDSRDAEIARRQIMPQLETAFGIDIDRDIPTLAEIVKRCVNREPTTLSGGEFQFLRNKNVTFPLYLKHLYGKQHDPVRAVLLDDAVEEERIVSAEFNLTVDFVNVKQDIRRYFQR